jgi:Rv2175c C-terminal domain of unknown function
MAADIELLTFDEAAAILGTSPRRFTQFLSDGDLVAVVDSEGVRRIPAQFLQGGAVVKALRATIRLLRDAHYQDPEIIEWMFRPDDSLPGTPLEALRENRGREVKRRAQVAGF